MKTKLTAFGATAATYLMLASTAFAQINITPGRPRQGIGPGTDPRIIITNAFTVIIVIAIVLVLAFLIWGAFDWITSGGDKEKVAGARKKILAALIGLVILALAFVIARIAGSILGIDFSNLTLPRLDGATDITPAVPPPGAPSTTGN